MNSFWMLHRQLLHHRRLYLGQACRFFLSISQRREILSREFALNDKWVQRHNDLKVFKLGGSYEWITSVHKKFIGDGKASAVDVDAAVCLAEEEDQLDDVVELIYKLRHTENTADMLPSTEYAVFRFVHKWNDTQKLLKLVRDPINYGVFMNPHLYCLIIDHFLGENNIPVAAEIVTNVMKQELFDTKLLNLLSLHVLLKWLELPADQRTFHSDKVDERPADESEHMMEEEEIIFRLPYLRVAYNDGHFDLEDPLKLVLKSLKWFLWHVEHVEWKLEVEELVQQVSDHVEEEPFQCGAILSSKVLATLKNELPELESQVVQEQTKLFDEWRNHRRVLIETQAKSLDFQLRLEELKEQENQTKEEIEVLQFFDNRVKWESMAEEKTKLLKDLNVRQQEDEETEDVYAKTMFDRMRDRVVRKQLQSK